MENCCFLRKKSGIYQTFCLTDPYDAIMIGVAYLKSLEMKKKVIQFLALFQHLTMEENRKRLSLLGILLLVPLLFSFSLFSVEYGHNRLVKTEIRENANVLENDNSLDGYVSLGVYMLRENVAKEDIQSSFNSKKEGKVSICEGLAKDVCQKSFVRRIIYIDRF